MKRSNMLTDRRIADLYKDVPEPDLAKFKAFLEAYPYRNAMIDGVDWAYIATEPVGDDLLCLAGAQCAPEVSWRTIVGLAGQYRVIAPEYPPVKSMEALVDGIAEILRREGTRCAHVVGGSYGGFVAQVFVRRHPELTRSLVLSHTFPPSPEGSAKVEKSLRILNLLPERVLLWLMGKRLSGLLPEKTPETAGLHATHQEMMRYRLTKPDLLALLQRTVDFTNMEFSPKDLEDWAGKTLLVLSDNDPGTPEEVRARMRALYPNAQMHVFHGSGHVTAVTKQEEYQGVIKEFLENQ